MAKEYGFGVVGAGMIGNFHAEAIKGLPNGKLVAVCDKIDDERGDAGRSKVRRPAGPA